MNRGNNISRKRSAETSRYVLIVASVASMIDQFNIPNLKILKELNYDIDVACNFDKGNTCTDEKIENLLDVLDSLEIDCYQIDFNRRAIDLKDNIKAFKQLSNVVKGIDVPIRSNRYHQITDQNKYIFIHCHSPIGGVIGRIVAKKYHIRTIYTAHGFHFYTGAPLRNWLFYYTIEWILSFWTNVLITINKEDYERAQKSFHAERTLYIPGVGIDIQRFQRQEEERVINRNLLGIKQEEFLILSVGELNKNKNHETIIHAVAELKNKDIHYFIAGQGKLREYLEKVTRKLDIQNQVHILGYRNDIEQIYQCADLYVLPSIREGLNVSLMEAMASGLPIVCSNIRGNKDLVVEGKGGFLCKTKKVSDYSKTIEKISSSKNIAESMGDYNRIRIERFGSTRIKRQMKQVYQYIILGKKDV